MRKYWITLLFQGFALLVFSQEPSENEAIRLGKEKIPIRGSERFDFILGRNFQLPVDPELLDSVPIDPTRSGSYNLGISYSIPFGSVVALKFEPRATWNKFFFDPTEAKRFPTDSNATYLWEKHRMFYGELAGGLKFNLLRNKDEKVQLFMEMGGFFGYNLGAEAKRRSELAGEKYTEKFHSLDNINKLRYGAYMRFGTSWIALNFQYRFSPVYNPDKQYVHPSRGGALVDYPKPAGMELGVVIML